MANEAIKQLLDKFHYHEMMDRTSMLMQTCEQHLLQHPVAKIELEVKQNIETAIEYLWKAYQLTGEISNKRFNDE